MSELIPFIFHNGDSLIWMNLQALQ